MCLRLLIAIHVMANCQYMYIVSRYISTYSLQQGMFARYAHLSYVAPPVCHLCLYFQFILNEKYSLNYILFKSIIPVHSTSDTHLLPVSIAMCFHSLSSFPSGFSYCGCCYMRFQFYWLEHISWWGSIIRPWIGARIGSPQWGIGGTATTSSRWKWPGTRSGMRDWTDQWVFWNVISSSFANRI